MIIITRVSIRQPTGAERVIIIRNTTCWPCGVYLSSSLEEVWTLLFGGLGLLFSYRKWWLVVTGGKKVQHFLSFRGNYAFCQSASPLPRNDCSQQRPQSKKKCWTDWSKRNCCMNKFSRTYADPRPEVDTAYKKCRYFGVSCLIFFSLQLNWLRKWTRNKWWLK